MNEEHCKGDGGDLKSLEAILEGESQEEGCTVSLIGFPRWASWSFMESHFPKHRRLGRLFLFFFFFLQFDLILFILFLINFYWSIVALQC